VERRDEFFWGDTGLLENTVQCSNFEFAVKRHHASAIVAAHYNVTTALPNGKKSQTLKNTDTLGATNAR
jgi:hypothetical protein